MIHIKAWTNSNKLVERTYDDPEEAALVWDLIRRDGLILGTAEKLSRAYLWDHHAKNQGPDKVWVP